MQFSGRVIRKGFARGSKSERPGIYLVTEGAEYLLRRQGANPFRDPELEALVGKRVRCEGTLHDYTLIVTSCDIIA
jgi:hypothetical protein